MPKHVYTAILLYVIGEYVCVYGLNVLRYAYYYVVDSTNVSVEKYVKAFRSLGEG